jgi:hypothetical protein
LIQQTTNRFIAVGEEEMERFYYLVSDAKTFDIVLLVEETGVISLITIKSKVWDC